MTEAASDTISDLCSCSSFATHDSLKMKGTDINLSPEEFHKENHLPLGLTALNLDLLSLFY